jgi:hypothetical protein
MPPQLYLYTYDTAGYALDDTGAGYNFSDLYIPPWFAPRAAAMARDDQNSIYLVNFDGSQFARSTDAGLTWTVLGTPWPVSDECITHMVCHTAGELHVFYTDIFTSGGTTGNASIWRSTNAGSSWTQIISMTANQKGRGGYLALGSSRLWYAESNTPLVGGVLPDDYAVYDIKSCNWDGSGIVLHGSVDFDTSPDPAAPAWLKLRPLGDTFCLAVPGTSANKIWKITSTGTTTDISPPSGSGFPWDAIVFDANTYVTAGESATTLAVSIYRTTNGGTSWSLTQVVPALEGFGERGLRQLILMDPVPGTTTDAYMVGYANTGTQQYIWKTTNAGLTWTSFRNLAALTEEDGDYLDFGWSGVLAMPAVRVSIPARLATIVG